MLITLETKKTLKSFLQKIKLLDQNKEAGKDKSAKVDQIIAFLEVINATTRKYSKKRELVFIDGGAGNCYLSLLVYYFYNVLDERNVTIHCIDNNVRLMEKNTQLAKELGFDKMFFHACAVSEYTHSGRPDLVYSLHACDIATDQTLFLGLETNAKNLFTVQCCQHRLTSKMRSQPYSGLTRHKLFKDKLAYMVGDSLRAMLIELQGYKVDVLDFVSSRATDKNTMLRAQLGQVKNRENIFEEYLDLKRTFNAIPALEDYLFQSETPRLLPREVCKLAS